MAFRVDYTGKKFGSLTVIKYAGRHNNATHWTCRCDCGNVKDYQHGNLQGGRSTRCKDCQYKHLKTCLRKNGVLITYQGQAKSMRTWSGELGIPLTTIQWRHQRGMLPNKIFSRSPLPNHPYVMKFVFDGKTQTVEQWANELGISRQAMYLRLENADWTDEQIFTLPATNKDYHNHPKRLLKENS